MLDFSSKIQNAVQNRLSFVIYRKPNQNHINLLVNDRSGNNRFLLHSFDSSIESSISDAHPLSLPADEFNFDLPLPLQAAIPLNKINQHDYEKLIQSTIHKINHSDISKIVISRINSVENQNYHLFRSFSRLLAHHPTALVYIWHEPEGETWMGATPELLLSHSAEGLKTVSLAGTKVPEAEWTPKEVEEQQIVTDFILDAMKTCPDVKFSRPQTIQAGRFQHLKTYISAGIPDKFDLKELLNKLHPTPAVCGLPKKDAFDFIIENETHDRGFYAGYIGIETQSSNEYFVNLRCARFFSDRINLFVGGGITADSRPENEWTETELKSGTIMKALSL